MKYHYIDFETSPHKQGSSFTNFCLLVCCRRRSIESKLDYRLQLATEKQDFELEQLEDLRGAGILDPAIQRDNVYLDQRPEDDDDINQLDMNDCPEWALSFASRVKARGNLRTFRRIRRRVRINEKQVSQSSDRLLKNGDEYQQDYNQ